MEYNFLKREVFLPKKHFKKNRHIKLGKTENMFFAVLWFSENGKASFKKLYKRVYGYKDINIGLLRNMAAKLNKKGIKIISIYKYGYKLIGG